MEQKNKIYRQIIIFSLISLLFALTIIGLIIFKYISTFGMKFPENVRGDWGVLGDFFGGTLGPVLNLVTVVLLVASFLFQLQQVKDTKADADEAQRQAKEELRILQKQGFEQTFFAWLKSYREYISEIRRWDSDRDRESKGHKALLAIWSTYMHLDGLVEIAEEVKIAENETVIDLLRQIEKGKEYDQDIIYSIYIAAFEKLYKKQSSTVGTMLRSLYRLIKWIDDSDLTPNEKYSYIAIVRAQLSMAELGYLMLNGLTDRGAKFRPLVNKYALLDNIEQHLFVRALSTLTVQRGYETRAFNSDIAKASL